MVANAPQLAEQIFGVKAEPVTAYEGGEAVPTWHSDVRVFRVMLDGKLKAWFYLDPYSRPSGGFPHAVRCIFCTVLLHVGLGLQMMLNMIA